MEPLTFIPDYLAEVISCGMSLVHWKYTVRSEEPPHLVSQLGDAPSSRGRANRVSCASS
jgi:hypothetical protein